MNTMNAVLTAVRTKGDHDQNCMSIKIVSDFGEKIAETAVERAIFIMSGTGVPILR